jgi:glycosyltransferase involved in cell wall biosynthesis
MNILIVVDGFWPEESGGICKSLLYEIRELHRLGHSIVVLTKKLKKDSPWHESRDDCEIFRYFVPPRENAFYRLYPLFTRWYMPRIVPKLHEQFKFDAASIHNPFQCVFFPFLKGVPIIYTFHAPMNQEVEIERQIGKYGRMNQIVKRMVPYLKRIDRKALKRSARIIVRSHFMRKEVEKIYLECGRDKIRNVPLGVDTDSYPFLENSQEIRMKLNLPLRRPILLTVRRLAARMGLEHLITAMSNLIKSFPEILILIAGTGYLEKELKNQVEFLGLTSHVQFLGFVPEEVLYEYYQSADLFVMPSANLEGFGLSTIEALSCGTPAVVTPVGANPEIMTPLDKSFICKSAEPPDLDEKINWFLKTHLQDYSLRLRCRNYCVDNFSVHSVTRSLIQIFEEAVFNHHGSNL